MLQIAHVANGKGCKLHVFQIACVANCMCYKLHVLQIGVANCMCCKLHALQIAREEDKKRGEKIMTEMVATSVVEVVLMQAHNSCRDKVRE